MPLSLPMVSIAARKNATVRCSTSCYAEGACMRPVAGGDAFCVVSAGCLPKEKPTCESYMAAFTSAAAQGKGAAFPFAPSPAVVRPASASVARSFRPLVRVP